MGGLFNYDNVIFNALSKFFDCILLSVLWFIFCIPIVTIGASTTALYHTTHKVIRYNRSHLCREFWRSFKLNFKQSTIVWLLLLLLFMATGTAYYFTYNFAPVWNIPKMVVSVFLAVLHIVLVWTLYVFPYIARFVCATKRALKNSFLILMANLWWSVLLWGVFVVSVFLVFLLPILILVMPTVTTLVNNLILERVFKKYMSEEDLAKEEELNLSARD